MTNTRFTVTLTTPDSPRPTRRYFKNKIEARAYRRGLLEGLDISPYTQVSAVTTARAKKATSATAKS